MCKYCNVEPGDFTVISREIIQRIVGDRVCGHEKITVELYINDNDPPEPYLVVDYSINEMECINTEVPIKYCPFCGRKLT